MRIHWSGVNLTTGLLEKLSDATLFIKIREKFSLYGILDMGYLWHHSSVKTNK